MTTPARTIADLAAVAASHELRAAVRRGQATHLINLRRLAEVVDRLGPRRGVRKLKALLDQGPAPTRSELEDIVLDLIIAGGFARPDVNEPLTLDGCRVVPDFRWTAQRLVIEADGASWHDQKIAREDDAERQALLEAHGERVLRVTWRQAIRDRGATVARIRHAGAPLARGGAA